MVTEQTENVEQRTLADEVKDYEPTQTHNIAELDYFNVNEPTQTKTGTNKEGKNFSYKVLIRDGKEYRIPWKVLGAIQNIRKSKPNITAFQVLKTGTTKEDTVYTTIPHVTGN